MSVVPHPSSTPHSSVPRASIPDEDPWQVTAHAMPKVLLHEHLDGGLRVATLLELLERQGLDSPAHDVAGLTAWFEDRAHAGSLEEYLRGFPLTVAAMASPDALERVAFEAAEDARLDGCILAEFRIAPLLFEPLGVPPDAVVEALLSGLSRSGLPSGLIVCAMRHHADEEIARSAELAMRWHRKRTRGADVVGFDLAGPEAGWPASRHAQLLQHVCAAGLGLTLHAGEADEGLRVLEALRLGATRIGHGIRLVDLLQGPQSREVLAELHTRGGHLEVCPTSNVQTGGAVSLRTHPIRALWQAGVSLSFHTDNRLMSCVSHSGEALALVRELEFSWSDLVHMGLMAAQSSFMEARWREGAQAALRAWRPPPQGRA